MMVRGWVIEDREGNALAWAPCPIYRTICQPPGRWRPAEDRDMPLIEQFVGPAWKRALLAFDVQGK